MSSKSASHAIAIFASGSGTNAEAIIRHFQHHPSIRVKLVLSNNENAKVVERAKQFDISTIAFSREEFKDANLVLNWLQQHEITHVVLAGFLWLIPAYLVKAFPNHIVNIHPALLPKFGGKGMYGMKVHEAVKQANETQTGITIHLVNERYDEGAILFQASCPVTPGDTAEQIAKKVQTLEHQHYPVVIENWIQSK